MDNENLIIPKIIHYCWFGGKKLPQRFKKYIRSWEKYFPGYTIKEWNEDNFNVNINPYVSEAYESRKYAFVSDYARFWILYNYGGIYFDTDVKVIKSFDDIISEGSFMGRELTYEEAKRYGTVGVAPGLGIGSYPKHPFYKIILDFYQNLHFKQGNGVLNQVTVVDYVSKLLEINGLKNERGIQKILDINIYPSEYFCPISPITLHLSLSDKTHSIHYFAASWIPSYNRIKSHFGKKHPKIMKILIFIKSIITFNFLNHKSV